VGLTELIEVRDKLKCVGSYVSAGSKQQLLQYQYLSAKSRNLDVALPHMNGNYH
jgi:hypothetical protein